MSDPQTLPDPDAALHAAVPGKYKPAPVAAPPAATPLTVADVFETGPRLEPLRPAGPDSFRPAPSWSELYSAARPEMQRATPLYDETKIGQGYAPIVEELGLPASENPVYFGALDPNGEARFGSVGSPSRLATAAKRGSRVPFGDTYLADRAIQESLVIDQIRARRAKEPGFLPGVLDTADGLHAYFEQQQAAKRAAGAAVLERGSTFGRVTASLAAGAVESARGDPTFLPTMVLGGGGATSTLQAIGRDALINGILTAGQLPIAAHNMAENDEHMTAGEAVGQVVEGAAIGGVFGGAVHLASAHVPPALFKVMPESVQRRWAGKMRVGGADGSRGPLLTDVLHDMDNRELGAFAKTTIGDRMTPDERAAGHVVDRAQEVAEASPFVHGPQGDGAHQLALVQALQAIIDGAPRDVPTRGSLLGGTSLSPAGARAARPIDLARAAVPHDIVDFFRAKGLDNARAYGIAAGIAAEARGGDHTVVNPSSGAFGLGQWLGARKAALLKRYGPNPSRLEQLDYLWGELNGGDAGGAAVLAAKDPASVLDAYIRRFMRPAAGHETMSDLERGMAALGRRGELPEAAAGGGADDDLAAAAARDADAAEQEALDLSRGGDGLEAGGERAPGSEAPDYPILKRELFGSDADWFDAQLSFYRSQGMFGDVGAGAASGAAERGGAAGSVADAAAGKSAEIASGGRPGPFGREFPDATGDWQATLDVLRREQSGVVPGALEHPEIGSIDLPWGVEGTNRQDGFGLAKLEKYHPDVVADLPAIIQSMSIRKREPGRIQLEGPYHRGAVRLDWDGEARTWLLTAFAKDPKRLPVGRLAMEERAPGAPDDRRGAPGGRDGSPDRGAAVSIDQAGPLDNDALKAFDDDGDGRAQVADSLEHDYRMIADKPAAGDAASTGPLVYHGTNRKFDRFELKSAFRQDSYGSKFEVQPQAFFFSEDRDSARMFAEDRALVDERLRGLDRGDPRVSSYRLKVEQPFDLVIDHHALQDIHAAGFENWGDLHSPNPVMSEELNMLTGRGEPESWDDVQAMLDDPEVVSALRAEGYDAVRLREADGSISWAVFDPEQIVPAEAEQTAAAKRIYDLGDRQITLGELLDEFDSDRAAAAALRACAGPGA
jgi:hypothetical protein